MIDSDLFKNIEFYAKEHLKSSAKLYISRGQSVHNLYENILKGKLAEWCAYYQLIDNGYILDKPDMMIYSSASKSYDADLIVRGKENLIYIEPKHLHVKSVSFNTAYNIGISFLVEKNDPLVNKPDPNHYYCVMLQTDDHEYKVHTWLNSVDAEYKVTRLHLPTKWAVYL